MSSGGRLNKLSFTDALLLVCIYMLLLPLLLLLLELPLLLRGIRAVSHQYTFISQCVTRKACYTQ